MNIYELSDEDLLNTIENKEFDRKITTSKSTVLIILTQSWCPQWLALKSYLNKIDLDIDIYYSLYNKSNYFDKFRTFKENIFKNDQVPYLRFYLNGVFKKDSNYISQNSLEKIINNL